MQIPQLNLSKVGGSNFTKTSESQKSSFISMQPVFSPNKKNKLKIGKEREFLLDFFEQFHENHTNLVEMTAFTRDSFFQEKYLAEILAVGLPQDFSSVSSGQVLSARRGGGGDGVNQEQQEALHLELSMQSNLKSFFKERQIDISDIMAEIKETKAAKRSARAGANSTDKHQLKAYWQLATLIFTAFYLDHSQNEYLSKFFAQKLQTNISKLKMCLDIVQHLLSETEIEQTGPGGGFFDD